MRKYDSRHLIESESVPDFLKKEFVRRIDGNSRYSLRAFARDLGLSPSRLSESMNLKSGVSLATVGKISTRLKLSKGDRELLRDLYLAKGKQNRATRDMALKNIARAREASKIKHLDADKFKIIADWYHTAILQMTDLKQFRPSLDWIADSLGIPPDRARKAIERLVALGLLQNKKGRWVQGPELMLTDSTIPVVAIRRYHKDMMQKAFRAIDDVPIDRRYLQSMSFAIPSKQYQEICGKLQAVLKEAWEAADGNEKDQLYAINIQFFPLTRATHDCRSNNKEDGKK